jgi:hypothetical protein
MDSSAVREISLGNDLGEIVVKANGASVQIHADGSVDSGQAATPSTPERKPGATMPDGTVYVGISPDSGKAIRKEFAENTSVRAKILTDVNIQRAFALIRNAPVFAGVATADKHFWEGAPIEQVAHEIRHAIL